MKQKTILLTVLFAALALCSCSKSDEPDVTVAVTSVTLDKTAAALLIGATETLTATVNPTNATNKAVTWSSSDAAIATVSDKGVVTAQAVGTATITVTTADGNKTATCTVTVTSSDTSVAVTGVTLKATTSLLVDATETLTAIINPTNATNQNVTWTSSDATIATVSNTGVVTGVKVGTATITVTTEDGKKTATCVVTVTAQAIPVIGVTLNKAATSLLVDATETLTAIINPTNATNQNVTWTSSNATIATVSNTGVVTGVKAGTATITVTTEDGKKTATCVVTVTTQAISVIGVTLNKAATSLLVDATETLTASINPANATNKAVTWSSSDATVATVSNSGVVTAKAAGTATITVTTADGNKTATCTVTVNPIVVTSVSLDKTSATLVRAKTEALTATVNPTNATNKDVTWTSTDAGIVSVDAKGNVTAVKVGTATITVTTTDGAKTADCTITVIDPANPGGITADSWGNETGGSLNTH